MVDLGLDLSISNQNDPQLTTIKNWPTAGPCYELKLFQIQKSKMKFAAIFALIVLVAVAHGDDFEDNCEAKNVALKVMC